MGCRAFAFRRNESTRYISPTKTPEYLAAGLPVVSTPITDVVDPYGINGLVRIASSPEGFVRAIEAVMPSRNSAARLAEVDRHLCHLSWDSTWKEMAHLISEVVYGMREGKNDQAPIVRRNTHDGGIECSTT